jgi:diguanylate cyclase (GGDEF)-like protein
MTHQILVIDDSEKIHPLIQALLGDKDVSVQSATDANHGLVLASSICPDLILLDVDMPEMDGFEACKYLKANPETAGCPVIFLTARADAAEKVKGFGLGACDYVTKPFHPAELVARVRASLRTNGKIRSLEASALIDPATGLGNRAMFVRRLSAEICLRVRSGSPLSITLMDIDHMEEIKSVYGPETSGQVLAMIGRILTESCRVEDTFCHFGDGEFGIISPLTSAKDAVGFAEGIREILACKLTRPHGNPLSVLARECLRVTCSFGVAEAAMPYDRTMIDRANDALQLAQKEGGNRVSLALPPTQPMSSAA